MRVLYPSAHHDRFAHSIGVYYLGKIAFDQIHRNSSEFYSVEEINKADWEVLRETFTIACLLHDCGHAPFSHTLENYYLIGREDEIKREIGSFFIGEENFISELNSVNPSPHEKISALILLKHYRDALKSNHADPLLAARMILGCVYENPASVKDKVKNKLISLLNGTGFDVDSVDYIQRDTWTSGVSNVNIDFHRLFSSIMIKPDQFNNPQIVFKKQVLSVLENIIIGRNFLYKWIYSHHKVAYEQHLIESIIEKINHDSKDELFKSAFSVNSFVRPQTFGEMRFFLPTDDDIIYTFKKYYETDERIEELFSRKHKFKALWKSYFEFNQVHFKNLGENDKVFKRLVVKLKRGDLKSKYGDEIFFKEIQPKLKSIESFNFYIDIDGKFIDASEATNLKPENLKYFIIYTTEKLYLKKEEIINSILSLQ